MLKGKAYVKFGIIHEMLSREDNVMKLSLLCDLAGVSRSGYYRWLKNMENRKCRDSKDRADFELILEAYKYRGYPKGARGIYMYLLHKGPEDKMNLKKIRRLMRKYELFCPIRKLNPYRKIARALRTNTVAPNILQREFKKHGPRTVLLTDITYIRFGNAFVYLSTIIDAFTMQVLAYRLSNSLQVDFVLETVNDLVANHGISLNQRTLIHSDQGCHYTSYQFIRIVKDYNLRQSMSRRGNCWDNSPQESFFGHMKDEINFSNCRNFSELKAKVDDWMDYYNNERYQWDLAKLSPNQFYEYYMTGIYPV
mgnify:FL=1